MKRKSCLRFETGEAAHVAAPVLEAKGVSVEIDGDELNLVHEGGLALYTGAIYPRTTSATPDVPELTGAEIMYWDEPLA